MAESAGEVINKILAAARNNVEALLLANAATNEQQRALLNDVLKNIQEADQITKDADSSRAWYGRKSRRFEYANSVISFVPAIAGVAVIILAFIWLTTAGKERDILRQLITYDKGWVTAVSDSLLRTPGNASANVQLKRDSLFYLYFVREKQLFDSMHTAGIDPEYKR